MVFISTIIGILFLCQCNGESFSLFGSTRFKLYKREFPTTYTYLSRNAWESLSNELFDPKLPTRNYIHGYLGSEKTIEKYRNAFLDVGDYNFIALDWTKGAHTINYFLAKTRMHMISEKLAELIDGLVAKKMKLKDLILIGHSLGAHMAGLAAKKVKSGKVGTIIGLDPASVGFPLRDVENRLDKSNAEYVQIIHTNTQMYGISGPIGHADFYPNGGTSQPGCPTESIMSIFNECSHSRSSDLFRESLATQFTAIQCDSYEEILMNRCTFSNVTAVMGGDSISNKPYGIFYLETRESSPFVIRNYKSFENIQLASKGDEKTHDEEGEDETFKWFPSFSVEDGY